MDTVLPNRKFSRVGNLEPFQESRDLYLVSRKVVYYVAPEQLLDVNHYSGRIQCNMVSTSLNNPRTNARSENREASGKGVASFSKWCAWPQQLSQAIPSVGLMGLDC